mgnify:CR=1 FL=1
MKAAEGVRATDRHQISTVGTVIFIHTHSDLQYIRGNFFNFKFNFKGVSVSNKESVYFFATARVDITKAT